MQLLYQLGTKRAIQAVSCRLLGFSALRVLTAGDCARMASHRLALFLASGPYGLLGCVWGGWEGTWPGSLAGQGGEGEGGRGVALSCELRQARRRPRGHISVRVSPYGLGYEIAGSCGIQRICVSLCCVLQRREREKGGDENFLLWIASVPAQTINFHLHGFLSPIFSWTLSVSLVFSKSSGVFSLGVS